MVHLLRTACGNSPIRPCDEHLKFVNRNMLTELMARPLSVVTLDNQKTRKNRRLVTAPLDFCRDRQLVRLLNESRICYRSALTIIHCHRASLEHPASATRRHVTVSPKLPSGTCSAAFKPAATCALFRCVLRHARLMEVHERCGGIGLRLSNFCLTLLNNMRRQRSDNVLTCLSSYVDS